MRAIYPVAVAVAALFSPNVSTAQVAIKRTIPRIYAQVPTEEANLRRRVRSILEREVRLRSEYEDFVRDVTALGPGAVPVLISCAGRRAADRYVTEALLRMGGPDVRDWIDEIATDEDAHVRQAFLAGVPAVVHLSGTVRFDVAQFLHDKSPQVRILAIEKLHTLVPATDLLTRCHDITRDVAHAAILLVSRRWVFLDHRDRELKNLASFVEILEMHARDDRWDIGSGFRLAFLKDRIADTKLGRDLRRRTSRLPWFRDAGESIPGKRLAAMRAELGKRTNKRGEFLAKSLQEIPAAAGAELLLVLAEDNDAGIRLAACEAGLALLDPELSASFVRFLKDPDPEVRKRAKDLLEQTGFYADQKLRWGSARRM